MTMTNSTTTPARAPGTVPALVGQGYRVNSDEWWTFDTEKYDFFHEQCCDCGLNHKTHIRLIGTKIRFRHERRDRPPTPEEIDNADLPNAPDQARLQPSPKAGGSASELTSQPERPLADRYNELLYAVARKFPGESRHETALRYIRQAEEVHAGPCMQNATGEAALTAVVEKEDRG